MDEQADVEALVREIEAGADPEAREHARAVVGAAIAFHREGVSRLVDAIRRLGGDAALLDLASDEATAAVLVLHGLHPVDPETRLRDALEAARPVLGRMNASAEVIREGDTLRVRVREGTPGQGAMVHVDAVVAAAAPDVAVALERSSDGALVPLERLRAKVRARPGGDAAAPEPDRCELCGTPLPDAHDHLAGEARALRCACMPCAMLFESATGAWRRVPRRAEALPTFLLTDETWAALEVPMNLAFFVRPGAGASVVARYPGPAGAAESTLRLDAWSRVAADNPVAATLVPDVEALLIRRRAGRFEVFRAPIDVCYALVGHIRRAWRGLGGGAEAWARIDAFFDDLRRTGRAVSLAQAERLAAALLYEGYALYPYRRSSLKNRRRFDFGVVFPAGWVGAAGSDLSALRAEVLVRRGGGPVSVRVVVRFLRLVGPADEAVEEAIAAPEFDLDALARRPAEPAVRAEVPARVVVRAEVEDVITARLAVDVSNTSPLVEGDREAALRASLVATHVLIEVCGARLASAIEPPAELAAAAARCRSVGLFPVLMGDPAEATAMLASPIILHDHPRVAPESPHDLYDATEIDEILTLRILTLTDAEKRLAAEDPRVAALLARVERGGVAALERLHGARRDEAPDLAPGDRVRLRPSRRADVFDLALDGKAATVASVERDLEGRAYVTVTVDDDPGADLGAHGHRFFFHPEEVERLP